MASVFTKIINREIPGYIVHENDDFIAFLDAFPLVEGHTLVVPKKVVDKIWDLDKDTYTGLMQFAYEVAQGLEKAVDCVRVGVAVIGLEVPHVHVHLVPMNSMSDINFSNPKKNIAGNRMEELQEIISAKL
ncbi:MAG: HIT domain-containing protein [Weeksellaceae bacterium]|nr:HIT domain-containing protein [Weeksellaceae bacterium]